MRLYAFVVVNDADGTFRVHRRGCVDIARRMKNGAWDAYAESAEAVVKAEREELREDFGDEAADFTFVILPCVKYAWTW